MPKKYFYIVPIQVHKFFTLLLTMIVVCTFRSVVSCLIFI